METSSASPVVPLVRSQSPSFSPARGGAGRAPADRLFEEVGFQDRCELRPREPALEQGAVDCVAVPAMEEVPIRAWKRVDCFLPAAKGVVEPGHTRTVASSETPYSSGSTLPGTERRPPYTRGAMRAELSESGKTGRSAVRTRREDAADQVDA